MEHRKRQVALQPQDSAMIAKVVRDLISDPAPEARFGADALEIALRLCEATDDKTFLPWSAGGSLCRDGRFCPGGGGGPQSHGNAAGAKAEKRDRVAETAGPLPRTSEAHHPAAVAVI